MLPPWSGFISPRRVKLGLLHTTDAGRMLLANVGTYLSADKESHFTGLDSSATLL
jgi:hypothetical protein